MTTTADDQELPSLEDETTALTTANDGGGALTAEQQLEAELDAMLEQSNAVSQVYEANAFTERGPDKMPLCKVNHQDGLFTFENPFNGMPVQTTTLIGYLTRPHFYPVASVPEQLGPLPEDIRALMEAVPKRSDGSSMRFCVGSVPPEADPVRYPNGDNPNPAYSTFAMVNNRYARSPDMVGKGYHNGDGNMVTKACKDCRFAQQHNKEEAGYDAICKPRGFLDFALLAWKAGSKNTQVRTSVGIKDVNDAPIPGLVAMPIHLILSPGMTRAYTDFVDELMKKHKAAPNRCLVAITVTKTVNGNRTYGEIKLEVVGEIFTVGTKDKPGKHYTQYRELLSGIRVGQQIVEAQIKANYENEGSETEDGTAALLGS